LGYLLTPCTWMAKTGTQNPRSPQNTKNTTSYNLQCTFPTPLFAIGDSHESKRAPWRVPEDFFQIHFLAACSSCHKPQTEGERRTDRKLTMLLITSTTIASGCPRPQYQVNQLDPLDSHMSGNLDCAKIIYYYYYSIGNIFNCSPCVEYAVKCPVRSDRRNSDRSNHWNLKGSQDGFRITGFLDSVHRPELFSLRTWVLGTWLVG
jgi:hypothetical protein